MIRIGGQPADPTTYSLWTKLSASRRATIQAQLDARDIAYEWATFPAFEAWAFERVTDEPVDPVERIIANDDVLRARTLKRRYEMALNCQPLLPQIGAQAPFDTAPISHLPNFDLHVDAPEKTFYAPQPSGHRGLFQMQSAAQAPDNDQRRARSEITIYTHPETGRVHAHSNVDRDVIHSVVDTSAELGAPPPTKKRKLTQAERTGRGYRGYGGHATTDFAIQPPAAGPPAGAAAPPTGTMRGHSVGYADTILDPTVEVASLSGTTSAYAGHEGHGLKVDRKSGVKRIVRGTRREHSMTSNDNPRCYYPESDSGGGNDLGATVKNHAHEAKTREVGGTYVQSCSYTATDPRIANGMRIPHRYHYQRGIAGDTEPYASFVPGENLTGTADALWSSHVQAGPFPAPKLWDPTTPLSTLFPHEPMQAAPSTPNFMPDAYTFDEEDTDGPMTVHEERMTEDTRELAFERTGDNRYRIGRFLPSFPEPEQQEKHDEKDDEKHDAKDDEREVSDEIYEAVSDHDAVEDDAMDLADYGHDSEGDLVYLGSDDELEGDDEDLDGREIDYPDSDDVRADGDRSDGGSEGPDSGYGSDGAGSEGWFGAGSVGSAEDDRSVPW